jgi:hypothetical protein
VREEVVEGGVAPGNRQFRVQCHCLSFCRFDAE